MQKAVLIYWSGTGNTQSMAEAIAEGIRAAGGELDVFPVFDITAPEAAAYDHILLGCPSMGAEALEEDAFEPFFTSLVPKLAAKRVALFGSYGWGDGEWMREWQKQVTGAGATLFEEGLILNEAPDSDGLAECKEFGRRFARS